MRFLAVAASVALVLGLEGAHGAHAAGGCGSALPAAPRGLPAPVVLETLCGRYTVEPDGRVRIGQPSRSAVPESAGVYADGTWGVVRHGHLVVGRGHTLAWRSHGRFAPLRLGVVTLGRRAVAFSYGNRMYMAPRHGAERLVGRGYPLGWTRRGLLTFEAGAIVLRDDRGTLVLRLATRVRAAPPFDTASQSLLFETRDRTLFRTDGRRVVRLRRLAALGFRRPQTVAFQALGPLVALSDAHRLVLLGADGSRFASTPVAGAPQSLALRRGAVAFTVTRGYRGYRSIGTDAIELLHAGASKAVTIHRVRLRFAICGRGTMLAWRGRWLLYATSEGRTAAVDTLDGHAIDLTRLALRLPGLSASEGHLRLTVAWAR